MEEVKPTLGDLKEVVEGTLRRRGLEGEALQKRVKGLVREYLTRAVGDGKPSVKLEGYERPEWLDPSNNEWKHLKNSCHATCMVLEMVEVGMRESTPEAFPYLCAAASALQQYAQHKWAGETRKLLADQEFAECISFLEEANPLLVRCDWQEDVQLKGVVDGLRHCLTVPLKWSSCVQQKISFDRVEAHVRSRLVRLELAWKQLRKDLVALAEGDEKGQELIKNVLDVALKGISALPKEGEKLHGALANLFDSIDQALEPLGRYERDSASERCNGDLTQLQSELERVTKTDVARRAMQWLLLQGVGALKLELEMATKPVLPDLTPEQRRQIVVCVINCDQALHEHGESDSKVKEIGQTRMAEAILALRLDRNVLELYLKNLWIHSGKVFCDAGISRETLVKLVKGLRDLAVRSGSTLSKRLDLIGRSKKGGNARIWRAIDHAVQGYRDVLSLVVASLEAFCGEDASEVIYRELMAEASKKPVRKVRKLPPVRKVEERVVRKKPVKGKKRKKVQVRGKQRKAIPVVLPGKVLQIHQMGQTLPKGPSRLKTMLTKLEARLIVPQPPSIDATLEMLDLLRRTLEACLEGESHELGPRIDQLRKSETHGEVVKAHGKVLDRLASAYRALYYPSACKKGEAEELRALIERCEAGENVRKELEAEYVVPVLSFLQKFVALERPEFVKEEVISEGKYVREVKVPKYEESRQKWDAPVAHEGLAGAIRRLQLRLDSELVMPVVGKASAVRLRRRDGLLRHVRRFLERIVDKLATDPMLDLNSSCLDLMNMVERAAREVTVAAIEHWDESGLLDQLVSKKFQRLLRYCNDVPLLHAHLQELARERAPNGCPSWLKGAHHKLHYSSDHPIQKLANQMVLVRRSNVKGAFGPWVPKGTNLGSLKRNASEVIENTRQNQVLPALEYVMEILDKCFVVEGE